MKFAAGLKLAGAALALALSGSTLHAEGTTADAQKAAAKAPVGDEFVTRVFGGPVSLDKTTYACFTRSYDSEHLAEHPQQKVSAMKLLLTAEKYPEDNEMNYSFRLGVKYRNKSGNYDSSGDCGHGKFTDEKTNEAVLGCGVDCDGGGIDVHAGEGRQVGRSSSSSVSASGRTRTMMKTRRRTWLLAPTTRASGSIGRR